MFSEIAVRHYAGLEMGLWPQLRMQKPISVELVDSRKMMIEMKKYLSGVAEFAVSNVRLYLSWSGRKTMTKRKKSEVEVKLKYFCQEFYR